MMQAQEHKLMWTQLCSTHLQQMLPHMGFAEGQHLASSALWWRRAGLRVSLVAALSPGGWAQADRGGRSDGRACPGPCAASAPGACLPWRLPAWDWPLTLMLRLWACPCPPCRCPGWAGSALSADSRCPASLWVSAIAGTLMSGTHPAVHERKPLPSRPGSHLVLQPIA